MDYRARKQARCTNKQTKSQSMKKNVVCKTTKKDKARQKRNKNRQKQRDHRDINK